MLEKRTEAVKHERKGLKDAMEGTKFYTRGLLHVQERGENAIRDGQETLSVHRVF